MQGMLPADWLKAHFEPPDGQCSKVSANSELSFIVLRKQENNHCWSTYKINLLTQAAKYFVYSL